jgi:3-oxoacyl-[acyl-carrier protein] reductase
MGDTLKGRVAIVTGSGRGVGRAIAMALAAEGAKVVTNSRRPGGRVTAGLSGKALDKPDASAKMLLHGDAGTTAEQIRGAGGEATACYADISRFGEAKKLVEAAVAAYGKIDIVVNAAGIPAQGSVEEITEEKWDECLNSRPKGYFNVVHFAAPYMIAQGYGRIVNCASGAFMGDPSSDSPHYCAASAGVVGFTRAIAGELYSRGITANAFCPQPGVPGPDEVRSAARPASPPGPDLSALCPFIVFLCSEKSGHISGTVFSLSGNTISRHQEPSVVRTMIKPEDKGIWTVEEIDRWAQSKLLDGYRSICEQLQ